MKVLGCGSLAVATVKFTISKITKEQGKTYLHEKDSEGKDTFFVAVPSSVAKKLQSGDTVVVVCTTNEVFSFATSAMSVRKLTSSTSSEEIYNNGVYGSNHNINIFH